MLARAFMLASAVDRNRSATSSAHVESLAAVGHSLGVEAISPDPEGRNQFPSNRRPRSHRWTSNRVSPSSRSRPVSSWKRFKR